MLIDKSWIGLLGLLPVYLGIKGLTRIVRKPTDEEGSEVETKVNNYGNIFSVAAVTFANGGDNIGIYIPLFATLSEGGKVTMIFIFLSMVALWC